MNENITFPVVESFVSINGEGQRSGELALFIRFRGCNLNCSFCDTTWANSSQAECSYKTIEEICALVNDSGIKNVTLTGGEPLLQTYIDLLLEKILEKTNCFIEIETNGSQSIEKWQSHTERLSFTLDYKLPGSDMEKYMLTDNYKYLRKNDTVKFVCGDEKDLNVSKKIIDEFDLTSKCAVYLSPVYGKIQLPDMVEFMKENKMNNVKMQLQMHKFIWNPDERGV